MPQIVLRIRHDSMEDAIGDCHEALEIAQGDT
jgi:hypothetical protein